MESREAGLGYRKGKKQTNRKGKNNPNWKGGEIERICEACDRHFFTTSYWIKNGYARFCSQRCTHNFMRGVNATNWKGRIERVCETCGKHFLVRPWFVKKGFGRFCSRACVRHAIKLPKHHTKPEMIFKGICKKYDLPFKYTGDGSFWIGKNPSINPDFVDCNGKKIAVEIFSYWHDPLRRHCKIRYSASYEGRKKILKKYGWKLVVFWQEDLERKDTEQFVLTVLSKHKIQVPLLSNRFRFPLFPMVTPPLICGSSPLPHHPKTTLQVFFAIFPHSSTC